ncbi:MAG: CHAT domain-containing protein [Deltaproteobacteria bacterium]|nr:CHAT domain-containing protein [Deltaproteobacteria bacterium]
MSPTRRHRSTAAAAPAAGVLVLGLAVLLATPVAADPPPQPVDRAAMLAKAPPAGKALCHDVPDVDLEWCLSGCTAWPATTACLMARRWGAMGIQVALYARKNGRTVPDVAKEAGMDPAQAELLRLYADWEAIVPVDWNGTGALQGQAKATFAQAQQLAKDGTAAYAARDHDKAKTLLMRSTELVAKAYGPKHVEVAKAMVRVAYPEMKLRNYAVARKVLQAALERFRAVMPEDHPAIADAMQVLGQVEHADLHFTEARKLFEGAIARRRKTHGESDPKLATMWNNLGFPCEELADFRCKREALEKSMAIREVTNGPESLELATELSNLGVFLSQLGELDRASAVLERARELRVRHNAPAEDRATSYNNLGGHAVSLGLYHDAQQLFEQALQIWDSDPKTDPLKRAVTAGQLGTSLIRMGSLQAGVVLIVKVLELRRAKLPAHHPDVQLSLATVGETLLELARGQLRGADRDREVAKAVGYLEDALEGTVKLRGADHPDSAMALLRVAGARPDQGKGELAPPLFEKAIAILEKHHGKEHPSLIPAWNNYGVALVALSRTQDALAAYRKALAIAEALLGLWHPNTLGIRTNMLNLRLQSGKPDAAAAAEVEALVGETVRAVEAAILSARSDLGLLFLAHQHRQARELALRLQAKGGDTKTAYGALLATTGLAQRAEVIWRGMMRLQPSASSDVWATLESYRDNARQRMAIEGGAGSLSLPASRRRAERKRLDAERSALAAKLDRALPQIVSAQRTLRPDLAQVCTRLRKDDSRLVHFASWTETTEDGKPRDHYGAWVVTGKGCTVRFVALGPARAVDDAIGKWRDSIGKATACFVKKRKAAFCKRDLAAMDGLGATIRDAVWAPVQGALGKPGRVWIVATEDIAALAFDALPGADGRYLAEDWTIGYLPHPAALAIGDAAAHEGKASGALVVGDLDYEQMPADSQKALASWERCDGDACRSLQAGDGAARLLADARGASTRAAELRAGATICGQDVAWGRLPQTEAQTVAQTLASTGEPVDLVRGGGAVESLVTTAMQGRRIIHLATHGYFAPSNACVSVNLDAKQVAAVKAQTIESMHRAPLYDPLRLSAVILSGRNAARAAHATAEADGTLSAREVARLDLRAAELVALSACETGLGENGSADGAVGLSRSLLVAGAGSVVASLWQVPSLATNELFKEFYSAALRHKGHLSGRDVVDLMRDARLKSIARFRKQGLKQSAMMWAAFVPVVARP